jgi:RNA methyltransferase, TrmH family
MKRFAVAILGEIITNYYSKPSSNFPILKMISKNKQKYVTSLHQKKYRQEYSRFLVEGAKSVSELLTSDFEIEVVVGSDIFKQQYAKLLHHVVFEEASAEELTKISTFSTNDTALAIAKTKPNQRLTAEANEYVLMLDDIRDPGNLGTIIRIADWYGIKKIICSDNTVEFYNPKVIAATMGSFTRVQLYYTDLALYTQQHPTLPLYGTFLDGSDVHQTVFSASGGIVIGNESNGIGNALAAHIQHRITIPRYGQAESLNAGIATAVVLDNWRRRVF